MFGSPYIQNEENAKRTNLTLQKLKSTMETWQMPVSPFFIASFTFYFTNLIDKRKKCLYNTFVGAFIMRATATFDKIR